MISWDKYFMSLVYLTSMKSKDKSTHFGAVIVDSFNNIVSTGYNSFPRYYDDNDPDNHKRPQKYDRTEHAERNAAYSAAMRGVQLLGCKMYTQAIPCPDCARALVQVGIDSLVVHKQFNDIFYDNDDRIWKEKLSESKRILKPVFIQYYDEDLIENIEYCMFEEVGGVSILK